VSPISSLIKEFPGYQRNRLESKALDASHVNAIATRLSQEVFQGLSAEEKEIVYQITEDVVTATPCSLYPKWVPFFRLVSQEKNSSFAFIDLPAPFAESKEYATKSLEEINANFRLTNWKKNAPDEAIERIYAFVQGKIPFLNLKNLELSSLPACLFTDQRFKDTQIEENPLLYYPKRLPIGRIQNHNLFDKMANAISANSSSRAIQLINKADGILAAITAFTDTCFDTAVNKNLSKAKNLQYLSEFERYQNTREKSFHFEDFLSAELKKDIDSLFMLAQKIEKKRFYVDIEDSELSQLLVLLKNCVKGFAPEHERMLLSQSLVTIFPTLIEQFPSDVKRLWRPNPFNPLKYTAEEMRSFLNEHKDFCERITYLNLSRQGITVVPPEIFLFSNLEELTLNHNKLRAIPQKIGCLSALKILSFSHNEIQVLPDEIGDLTKLTHLEFEHNKVQRIPSAISALLDLMILDCRNNNIQTIPSEIRNLKKLRVTNCDNN
jgi:hypothetical protein